MKVCSKCKKERGINLFLKKKDINICEYCRYKCEHGKQCKSRCKECLGHSIYKNKCSRCRKYFQSTDKLQTCLKCRYYSNCPHGVRIKKKCKKCKICIHNKYITRCEKCGGSALCILCKKIRKNPKYGNGNYCTNCYIFKNPKSEVANKNRVLKQDLINDIYKKMYPKFK